MAVTAKALLQLIEHEGGTLKDAREWKKVLDTTSRSTVYEVMTEFSNQWNYHGVEYCEHPDDTYNQAYGLDYVNAGDTYALTLCYDNKKDKFYVMTWGDYAEKFL